MNETRPKPIETILQGLGQNKRIFEYFKANDLEKEYTTCGRFPKMLYKQHRDWTCSIACIRTLISDLISDVPDEDYFVNKYKLKPSPYYTKDIREIGMLESYCNEIIYSADLDQEKISLHSLQQLLRENYFIMAECLYNVAHWIVIMGYCAVRNARDTEEHRLFVYDPYYDLVRLLIADEFDSMWHDADGHVKEFIAIK